MKTIIRNFLSVMRRYHLATILNILGLSVAFAAFMVIMMQVDFDRSFDRFHKDADKIFRVEVGFNGIHYGITSRPMSNAVIESSPHVLAGAISNIPYSSFFDVEVNGSRNYFKENAATVTPSLPDVIDFEMIEGSNQTLHTPDNALIPQSLAKKIFGNEPATGKILNLNDRKLTVGGVYRDFPRNSYIQNIIYYPMPESENINTWGNVAYVLLLRLDDAANAGDISENLLEYLEKNNADKNFYISEGDPITIRLTPLPEVHFVTNVLFDFAPKASRQSLFILTGISIIIIIIAGINFNNFSAALVPKRIRSINTQKVLGGDTRVIRAALIAEAAFICLVSFAISIFLVDLFRVSPMASIVDADVSPFTHPVLLLITAGIALVTGVFSGLYPSFYITSFPPALVLKGSFGLSPKGRQLRNILMGMQFVASFALIIGAMFMFLQNYYMQHVPLGYDRDEIIITDLSEKVNKSRDAFRNRLMSFTDVEGVTFARDALSGGDNYMTWGRKYKDNDVYFKCLVVDYNFLDVMGIKVNEGRNFREEDWKGDDVYIFNEKAHSQYGLEIGEKIDNKGEIIGFVPDIKISSFRVEVSPMAFHIWGKQIQWGSETNTTWNPEYCYIKIKAGSNLHTAMTNLHSTLKEFDDTYMFDARFYDDVLNKLYESEQKLGNMITLFSLIAILISIVGVFGLVIFDSEYRRKEISIRKVFGSTTLEILTMFNKGYIRILAVCFILAAPIAYYAIYHWLQNFVYRTPMYWWVYIIAFVTVFVLTVSVVTVQNWRAANTNPAESIKSE